ncbi:MAG: hypothetical protein H7A30_02460 [Thermotogae bacterium]|nr:hypothetical protein [Thermotogota bacterium]
MKKTSLAQFINKKLGKVFFVSLMSLFLLGVLFIVSIYFESYEIRKEDFSTAVKYINLKTDMVINSTEKIYNTQIENVFSEIQDKYDSSDENSFEKYLKDTEINILNIKDVKIPAKSVNYYVINENGIIYKTDFETDLGLDLKPYSQFWEELKNMKPGESKFYPITEEVNTGKLRIYSYLKMNNGEILEIGVSVDDITDFYNEVVNDINKGFEDLEIYSKYYKPLLNSSSSLTETEKEFFRESIRDKKIIIKNKTPLRAVFYMASKSEYGNKYFKVTFLNSRFGIIFIFYFIIILLMFLIINFIKKRMKNNLVEIIEPIVNISGDMENFAENKESTFKAETTNIKEIDMIADNYLKMSQEINASFEELKAINEELNDSYRENTALISKIDKITDIIINLKRYRSTENFLSTVFRYITDFVPEVDYGLVTRIYQGKVNFIDGIGYDTEELNKINIPEESYIIRKNIEVIEINDKNIESINKSVLQQDKYEKLL